MKIKVLVLFCILVTVVNVIVYFNGYQQKEDIEKEKFLSYINGFDDGLDYQYGFNFISNDTVISWGDKINYSELYSRNMSITASYYGKRDGYKIKSNRE